MQQLVDEMEKFARSLPFASAGIKALVLDDSVFDRRRIRRISHDTRLGIIMDEISSLDALEAMLDQDRFDVILIDYNLPGGDGIEALMRIRRHEVNGSCPAIMVTGDDKSDVAVKALKMGCADYIAKDQMTAERLKSSILGAIERWNGAGNGPLGRLEIEEITANVMAKYTSTLQPKLARVIREMRSLRKSARDPSGETAGELERIERQCIQIWATLLDPRVIADAGSLRH